VMNATLRSRLPSPAVSFIAPDLYSFGAVVVSAPVGTAIDIFNAVGDPVRANAVVAMGYERERRAESDVWTHFFGISRGGIHHSRASDVDAARGPWLRRAFAVAERLCTSFRAVASR
jgi:hypothetical protein